MYELPVWTDGTLHQFCLSQSDISNNRQVRQVFTQVKAVGRRSLREWSSSVDLIQDLIFHLNMSRQKSVCIRKVETNGSDHQQLNFYYLMSHLGDMSERCEFIKKVNTCTHLCDRVGVEHFNRTRLNLNSVFHQHRQRLRGRDTGNDLSEMTR